MKNRWYRCLPAPRRFGKIDTWDETLAAIRKIISKEASRHIEIQTLASSLLDLSCILHAHYDKAPIGSLPGATLKKLAETALKQINNKKYDTELKSGGS